MQTSPTRQVRSLLVVLVAAAGAAVVAGSVLDFTPTGWLILVMGTSLVLWVGGAVGGHVTIARLLDRGTTREVVEYTRVLLFMIPRFFVPCGFVALGCGVALAILHGVPIVSYRFLAPVAIFALTTVVGVTVSAPGYTRLLRVADAEGATDSDVIRRLMPLAWVNRVELALVVSLGFTALVSVLPA